MNSAAFAAAEYHARGWSVIPVSGASKLPLVPWKAYMQRQAGADEMRVWGERFGARVGIAVVTGAVSRLVVLDCDGREGVEEAAALGVPRTPSVRTPRGGIHHYFKLDGEEPKSSAKRGQSRCLDIRGRAGYVVAPHTTRPDGKKYEWIVGPEEPLAPPPAWFNALCQPYRGNYVVHGSHERHSSHDGGGSGPRDLEAFIGMLPENIQRYVREGHDLSKFPSRSECDSVVILEMVAVGGDEEIIERVFSEYPIGEKYSEPSSGGRYLGRTIELAQQRIRCVEVKYADLTIYGDPNKPDGMRIHLGLQDNDRLIRSGLSITACNRFFDVVGIEPLFTAEQIKAACRASIGKKLRIKLGGRDGYAVGAFYKGV